MRFKLLLSALALLAACQTAPLAPPPAPRLLDAVQRIALPPAEAIVFAEDGESIIFTARDGASAHSLRIAIEGGDPEPLADGGADVAISYFPHDDRILLQNGEHLAVQAEDGRVRDLGALRFLRWRTQLNHDLGGFFAIDAGALVQVELAAYNIYPVYPDAGRLETVAPDGGWVAVLDDAGRAVVRTRTRERRPIEGAVHAFMFTPDARALIYAARADDGRIEAWRYDLASGERTPVMQAQADVRNVSFSPSGRYGIYTTGASESEQDIVIVDQQTDRPLPLSSATRDVRFNRDETQIAFRLANDPWPNDIFVSDIDGRNISRIVHAPNARQ